jgi:hypothetical protein
MRISSSFKRVFRCWLPSFLQIWLRMPVPTWFWSWLWTGLWGWLARWTAIPVLALRTLLHLLPGRDEEMNAARFVPLPQGQFLRKNSLKRRHSYGR